MKRTVEKRLKNKRKRELEKLQIKQRSDIALLEKEENSFTAQLSTDQAEQLKKTAEKLYTNENIAELVNNVLNIRFVL